MTFAVARARPLRDRGLRPVQIWVPDTRQSSIAARYRAEIEALAQSDAGDADVAAWLALSESEAASWPDWTD